MQRHLRWSHDHPVSPNIMTAQEYILTELEKLKVFESAQETLSGQQLEEAIYAKVTSKKFRKLKLDKEAEEITKQAIKKSIAKNEPIKINLLFGGNKLWRFDEAPEIDWAELFNVIYFAKWLKSIASVYEHGATFEYLSQDVSIESLNNVPRSETNSYSETFRGMLEWIAPYLPNRVSFTYVRHLEMFDNLDEYDKEIEEAKKIILDENKGNLPPLDDAMKASTELNVRLKPGQDDDPLWREKIELEHQAIFRTKTLGKLLSDTAVIPTCSTYFPGLLITGSTKRSYAKFWAAVGAASQRDRFLWRTSAHARPAKQCRF